MVKPYLTPSIILLVLANAVPLGGVLFFSWEVFPLMMLFWMENIIIGLLNLPRVLLAAAGEEKISKRLFMMIFFGFHYGFFAFVHGMFVYSLFSEGLYGKDLTPDGMLAVIIDFQLYWALVALFVSHAFSLLINFILAGELRSVSSRDMMHQPYNRVVVLHVAILVGGFLVQMLHEPLIGLLALVVVKTVVDVKAHIRERQKMRDRADPVPDFAGAD